MLKRILAGSVKTGAVLAATTTAAIMAASAYETGDPWGAVNSIAHMVDGDDVSPSDGFQRRESTLGLGLNASAMFFWAFLFEGAMAWAGAKTRAVAGVPAAALAYAVDYHIVPKRLTPGIEKRLSGGGLLAVYVVLAATFATSGLWNRSRS